MITSKRPGIFSTRKKKSMPRAVLTCDVGGTKTLRIAFLRLAKGDVTKREVYRRKGPTQKSPGGFFGDVYREYRAATRVCEIDEVVVGFPGSCGPDGRLLPGTAFNMNAEFAGVDIPRNLKARLTGIRRVTVLNDNIANFVAILHDAVTGNMRQKLLGKTIGYLAPGTGLGSGCAYVSESGRIHSITDCQLSGMMITLSSEHIEFLEQRNQCLPDGKKICIRDGQVMVEDIFSGRALLAITGVRGDQYPVTGGVLDYQNLAPEQATCIRMMGEIVTTIVRNGSVSKVPGHRQRLPGDQKDASKASIYFISGGMGNSPVGRAIVNHTKSILVEQDGANDIQFIHKKNSACYGAAIAHRYASALQGYLFTLG